DENGIWLIEQILQKCKKAKIIVYTAFEAPELILRAIQAGAHGYLLKDTKKELLLHQIESVMLGAAAFTPRVADYILHSWMNLKSHKQLKRKNSFHPLTEREKEILLELANGLTIADISDIIGIQESTVKTHIRKIYEKLQVNNKTAAIQRGIDLGVIE
ncbi:MAG: DNA-binding response regulator, partial [Candidatus Hydrogenedentota bacterium]